MALAKKISRKRQPAKSEAKLRVTKSRPESNSDLQDDYNRFMKTESGSEEYRKAGDELMNRVFSGK